MSNFRKLFAVCILFLVACAPSAPSYASIVNFTYKVLVDSVGANGTTAGLPAIADGLAAGSILNGGFTYDTDQVGAQTPNIGTYTFSNFFVNTPAPLSVSPPNGVDVRNNFNPGTGPDDQFVVDGNVFGSFTSSMAITLFNAGTGVFSTTGLPSSIDVSAFLSKMFFAQVYNNDGYIRIDGTVTQITSDAVPIPAALPLFAGGLGFLGWMARRRRKSEQLAHS